jgi:hypothetical protein
METTQVKRLNGVQMGLLRLFDRQVDEQESVELQRAIMRFYREKLDKQVEMDIQKKGITRKDFDDLLSNSQRTKQ